MLMVVVLVDEAAVVIVIVPVGVDVDVVSVDETVPNLGVVRGRHQNGYCPSMNPLSAHRCYVDMALVHLVVEDAVAVQAVKVVTALE